MLKISFYFTLVRNNWNKYTFKLKGLIYSECFLRDL